MNWERRDRQERIIFRDCFFLGLFPVCKVVALLQTSLLAVESDTAHTERREREREDENCRYRSSQGASQRNNNIHTATTMQNREREGSYIRARLRRTHLEGEYHIIVTLANYILTSY